MMGKCRDCGGEMKRGKALQNTLAMGIPDFPGMTAESRGQTVSRTGTPKMIAVLKCEDCGHSIIGPATELKLDPLEQNIKDSMEKSDQGPETEDCICIDWKDNIAQLNSGFTMQAIHGGGGYSGKHFIYCPWCARKLEQRRDKYGRFEG